MARIDLHEYEESAFVAKQRKIVAGEITSVTSSLARPAQISNEASGVGLRVDSRIASGYGATREVELRRSDHETSTLIEESCETAENATVLGAATLDRLVDQRKILDVTSRQAGDMQRIAPLSNSNSTRSKTASSEEGGSRADCRHARGGDSWLFYLLLRRGNLESGLLLRLPYTSRREI